LRATVERFTAITDRTDENTGQGGRLQWSPERFRPGCPHLPPGRRVRATLERLSQATGETVVWVVDRIASEEVVAVAQVQSAQSIRFVADIGLPWPIHATAAGQAFLAFSRRAIPKPWISVG
jgi:DNA-binding IclR family transcriptional regulator